MASLGMQVQPTREEVISGLQRLQAEAGSTKLEKPIAVILGMLEKVDAATRVIEMKGSDEEKEQQKRRVDQVYTHVERIRGLVEKMRQPDLDLKEKEKIPEIVGYNAAEIKTIIGAMREVSGRLEKKLSERERIQILQGAALDIKQEEVQVPEAAEAEEQQMPEAKIEKEAPKPVEVKVEEEAVAKPVEEAPTPAEVKVEEPMVEEQVPAKEVEAPIEDEATEPEPVSPMQTAMQAKAEIIQKFLKFVGEDRFAFFEERNRLKNELNSLDANSLSAAREALFGGDANRQYFTLMETLNLDSRLEAAKLALNLVKMLKENHGAVDAERLGLALDYIGQESVGAANYWAQFGGQCWAREIEILNALKNGTVSRDADGKVVIAK